MTRSRSSHGVREPYLAVADQIEFYTPIPRYTPTVQLYIISVRTVLKAYFIEFFKRKKTRDTSFPFELEKNETEKENNRILNSALTPFKLEDVFFLLSNLSLKLWLLPSLPTILFAESCSKRSEAESTEPKLVTRILSSFLFPEKKFPQQNQ